MKISDPLGKVYTHTMFKKKSYDMRADRAAKNSSKALEFSDEGEDLEGEEEEEEEEEELSEISDQSDDSLSTKSSRLALAQQQQQQQHRGGSTRRDSRPLSVGPPIISIEHQLSLTCAEPKKIFFKL